MQMRRAGQKQGVMAVLWSEFLALWFDRTRRRALPLLLATLLILLPSLPARADCSCELESAYPGAAHHHEEGEAHEHGHEAGEEHEHPSAHSFAGAQSIVARGGHAHLAVWSQVTSAPAGTACCSCPRAPLAPVSAVVAAPSSPNADSQALVYVRAEAVSPYCFDALTGLFGRAGPPEGGKPQLVFLASLTGRAPPVSI